MPSQDDTISGASSLLSRIKSPFRAKTRSVVEFFVQPDEPHRLYEPGDVVSGRIMLKVVKPLRVTHITACLHGFVQVYKAPNNPAQSYREYTGSTVPGKSAQTGYFGNGFASLFQDEVILCGEGRLSEGMYQFGYELVIPKDRLPSSIDFERGTISYMVTSTLTKPTTISPTVVCDRPLSLTENLDIATLKKPKPRVITLEPLPRRPKPQHVAQKRAHANRLAEDEQSSRRASQSEASSNRQSRQADGDSIMSPALSEISCDSGLSSGGTGSDMQSVSISRSALTAGSTQAGQQSTSSSSKKLISATIEMSRQGFLRGDPVHLRISIQHRKPVKSVHGVIVTLYRQAHTDMHPALPVVGKDGTDKAEDYYPKSKTGLGGLSLSSAGSSHVFRKDLAQTFAPLIVNPETLSADIKAAIRVPDDAFPTISTVPGAMISFKYFVEVVLDLQGKLSGLDRLFPSGGITIGTGTGSGTDGLGLQVTHMLDTQEIRREKSVVSCVFEVVVGTKDTQREASRQELQAFLEPKRAAQNGNGAVLPPEHSQTQQSQQSRRDAGELKPDGLVQNGGRMHQHHNGYHAEQGYEDYGYDYDPYYDPHNFYYPDSYTYSNGYPPAHPYAYPFAARPALNGNGLSHPPPAIPPPILEDESALSEKERLRRAEARLLPSQPPEDDAQPESSAATVRDFADSALFLHDPSSSTPAGTNRHPAQPAPPAGSETSIYPQDPAPQYSAPSVAAESSSAVLQNNTQEIQQDPTLTEGDASAGDVAMEAHPEAKHELAPTAPTRAGEAPAPAVDPVPDTSETLDAPEHAETEANNGSARHTPQLPRYEI